MNLNCSRHWHLTGSYLGKLF